MPLLAEKSIKVVDIRYYACLQTAIACNKKCFFNRISFQFVGNLSSTYKRELKMIRAGKPCQKTAARTSKLCFACRAARMASRLILFHGSICALRNLRVAFAFEKPFVAGQLHGRRRPGFGYACVFFFIFFFVCFL